MSPTCCGERETRLGDGGAKNFNLQDERGVHLLLFEALVASAKKANDF